MDSFTAQECLTEYVGLFYVIMQLESLKQYRQKPKEKYLKDWTENNNLQSVLNLIRTVFNTEIRYLLYHKVIDSRYF